MCMRAFGAGTSLKSVATCSMASQSTASENSGFFNTYDNWSSYSSSLNEFYISRKIYM